MPDQIDANGLVVKTASEITADLIAGLQAIYGADINVDQNGQDGQTIGIVTQAAVDIRELAVGVNNNFDPDQAVGSILDQRVTLNNIAREGGTYTIQPIDIVTSATVNLQGLDANFNSPTGTGFTVQDSSGNQFILVDSATLTPGTITLNFRAKQIGLIDVPVDTINVPVTIVPGVTTVNNSSSAITVGQIQETDPQLRTRRQKSVAISSNGYLNGLLGKVLNITGVTEAALYENVTNAVDADGIPAHGIWLIAAGGANSDIADAIYKNKSYGANMKGAVVVNKVTPSGVILPIKFDRPTAVDLYIRFSIKTTTPGFSFSTGAIKTSMSDALVYSIGAFAETSAITEAAIQAIAAQGGGGVAVLMEISDDGISYTDFLETPTLDSEWTVDSSRIDITVLA